MLRNTRTNTMEGIELELEHSHGEEDEGDIDDASDAIHSGPVLAMKFTRAHSSNDDIEHNKVMED